MPRRVPPENGARRVAAVGFFLVVLTWAALSGVLSNSFLNYDDDVYVTENPHVSRGLDSRGLAWALSSTDAANWHPVTWMSHMLDVELFGRDAARHHLTSLVLHTVNVVLLFWLLVRMTGALWRPAFVAALFAIHPLHVESVAWIAERKDVLSTLFWLLTLASWLRWLARKTRARYALVLTLFALGLMAKPMLVTLPFTLMLLDYWPLKRATLAPLWREKLPMFALASASCVVTVIAQRSGGALQTLSSLPFTARLANSAVAYVWYLGKTVWPTELAVFYPHLGQVAVWRAIGSAAFLVGVTVLAFRLARQAPFLMVGWLWYLGTLVPVIGLVQVGWQATADRYTYVPLVGIFAAISWGVAALVPPRPRIRVAVGLLCAASLLVLLPITRAGVRHFTDDLSLFTRASQVTDANYVAHNNLGLALMGRGRTDEAIAHYEEALRSKPDYVDAHNNLAVALTALGRSDEAVHHLERAIALDPNVASARVNLGNSLVAKGRLDAAIEQYVQALRARPEFFDAEQNLALVLAREGRHNEAIGHFERALRLRPTNPATHLGLGSSLAAIGAFPAAFIRFDEALRLKPDFPEAYNALGIALVASGRTAEAIERYEMALRLKPGYAEALNNAGLALASMRRLPEAIGRFEQAVRVQPDFADAHNNLGVALAQANRVPEAIAHIEQALRIDPNVQHGQSNLRRLKEASRGGGGK